MQDLLDDLKRLSLKPHDSASHHFMATIVCFSTGRTEQVKTEQYGIYEVVDGQQRITTLALMFKALEQRLDDIETKSSLGKLLVKNDNNLLLLQANNANQYVFNRYIREGVKPEISADSHQSDRRLASAIEQIEKFLDEWADGGELLALTSLLKNRLGFVVYDTEDKWSVHSIFESLNSRGLAVDWIDKAKSVLMGVAFEKAEPRRVDHLVDELHLLWSKIYENLVRVPRDGEDILRIAATFFTMGVVAKTLSSEDSIARLREFCDSADKTLTASLWLKDVADKMMELRSDLTRHPIAAISQARVLAISIMMAADLTDAERGSALEQLERVTFRIYGLYNHDARKKQNDYIRLATRIRHRESGYETYAEIMDKLRQLGAGYPVDKAVEAYLKEPNYEHPEDCRYLLWRYEEYLAEERKALVNVEMKKQIWSERSAQQTLEHILPQGFDKTLGWKIFDDAKARKIMDRLGNLILLPPHLNREGSNKAFSDKVPTYKKVLLHSMRELTCLDIWNVRSFEARQKRLKAFICLKFGDLPDGAV